MGELRGRRTGVQLDFEPPPELLFFLAGMYCCRRYSALVRLVTLGTAKPVDTVMMLARARARPTLECC
jgi:hypothetical protein